MKFALNLFGLGILFMTNWPRKKDDFIAVTPLVGSEEFYLEWKRSNPPLQYPVEEKLENKEIICEAILKNGYFFDDHGAQPINPREKIIYDYIRMNHSITFEDLPDDTKDWFRDFDLAAVKITNPYKFAEISVLGDVVHEHVFLCLAWNRKTRNIVDYFISREYDLNGEKNRGPRRRGRFVFMSNDMKKLEVVAVAEEPVVIEPWKSDEYHWCNGCGPDQYYHTDFMLKLVLSAQSRAICDLSTIQRIRLCSLVMNSKKYRKSIVKFSPHINEMEPQCIQVNLTRTRGIDFSLETWDATFPTWAIECKADVMVSNKMYSFYVSQGVKPNEFLISLPEKNKILLADHCFTDI